MKAISKAGLLAISLLICISMSCEPDPILDEEKVLVGLNTEQSPERENFLSFNDAYTHDDELNITLENTVSVQHSDDELLVLAAYGSGLWTGQSKVLYRESRIIDLVDWSCEGEGIMEVPGRGSLYVRTSCFDYPIPDASANSEWKMNFEIVGGTGEFGDVKGSGSYLVKQDPDSFKMESALMDGLLTY